MPIQPGRRREDKDDLLAALLTMAHVQMPASSSTASQAALVELWVELRKLLGASRDGPL